MFCLLLQASFPGLTVEDEATPLIQEEGGGYGGLLSQSTEPDGDVEALRRTCYTPVGRTFNKEPDMKRPKTVWQLPHKDYDVCSPPLSIPPQYSTSVYHLSIPLQYTTSVKECSFPVFLIAC